MYIPTFIGSCALASLIILRGPQCSGKTEVSQRLRETLDEKYKKRTYLLKLNEINTEQFKKTLNEALDKKYKYAVGELNYGDSYNADPRTWLRPFKDKHYQIVSFVLVGGEQVRLQRCKNDSPFDNLYYQHMFLHSLYHESSMI